MSPEDLATPSVIEDLAARLCEVRRNFQPIDDLPAGLVPPDVATAYRVADRVEQMLGLAPLGWKIAATTPAMQARLGSDQPVRGRTYACHEHSTGVHLPLSSVNGPMVECEFSMRLGADLPLRGRDWTGPEVAAAVASVHAGIEVAETRFVMGRRPGVTGLIADASSAGQYVVGEALQLAPDALGDVEVVLTVDGVARQRGRGSDVLGNPIRALVWLANALRPLGRGLQAGELISTGSVTGVYLPAAGEHCRVTFGGHTAAEVTFDDT